MNFDNSIMSKLLNIYSPDEIAKYIRLSLEDRNKDKTKVKVLQIKGEF